MSPQEKVVCDAGTTVVALSVSRSKFTKSILKSGVMTAEIIEGGSKRNLTVKKVLALLYLV